MFNLQWNCGVECSEPSKRQAVLWEVEGTKHILLQHLQYSQPSVSAASTSRIQPSRSKVFSKKKKKGYRKFQKSKTNLSCTGNYLQSIHIVLGSISNLELILNMRRMCVDSMQIPHQHPQILVSGEGPGTNPQQILRDDCVWLWGSFLVWIMKTHFSFI